MSVHVHQLHYGPDICRLNAMKYGRKLVQHNLMQDNIKGKDNIPNLFILHGFYPPTLIFSQLSFTHIVTPTYAGEMRCFVQHRELGMLPRESSWVLGWWQETSFWTNFFLYPLGVVFCYSCCASGERNDIRNTLQSHGHSPVASVQVGLPSSGYLY